jgi:hypothetical protein
MKLDFASPPRPILEVNFHHFCTFPIIITPWKFLVCSRSVYQIAVRATGEFRAAYRFPKVSLARDSVDCEETRFATGHSFGGVEFAAEFALAERNPCVLSSDSRVHVSADGGTISGLLRLGLVGQ